MRMGWLVSGLALVLLAGGADGVASPEGKHEKAETNEFHLYIEREKAIPQTISVTGVNRRVRIKWGNDLVIEGQRIVIHTPVGGRMIAEGSVDGGVSLELYGPCTNGGSPDLIISAQWLVWEFDAEK